MHCSRALREETRVSHGKALDKSVGIEATKVNRTYPNTRRLDAALFLPEEDRAEHEAEVCPYLTCRFLYRPPFFGSLLCFV